MPNAWKNQKKLLEKDIPSIVEINNIARNITDMRARALFILAYLTAGRISELVKYYKIKYGKHIGTNDSGKKRTIYNWSERHVIERTEGITKGAIQKINNKEGRTFLLVTLPNRKNRKLKIKKLAIPIDKEGELIDFLYEYLGTKEYNEPLFPFTPQRAWQILRKYGYNPHYLRHVRLTHLVTVYNFNEHMLRRFAGWTDTRPARFYIEIKWQDFMDVW